MSEMLNKTDRRKFIRIDQQNTCRFEYVSYSKHGIITSQLIQVVTKNLSNSGILFTTKHPPKLASIILLSVDQIKAAQLKEIKKKAFIFK